MEIANYLALLWGFSLVVIGLAFLMRPKGIKDLWMLAQNHVYLPIQGLITLVMGIASVLAYNAWDNNWQIVITILGWLLVLKGVVLMMFPETVSFFAEKFKDREGTMQLGLVIAVVLGCVLTYFGFIG